MVSQVWEADSLVAEASLEVAVVSQAVAAFSLEVVVASPVEAAASLAVVEVSREAVASPAADSNDNQQKTRHL